VTDRGIACAEVSVNGGKRVVRRLATFVPPKDAPLDKPEAAGAALAAFLRQHKFSASRAVVGLPAKWLFATERDLPPAGEEQARGMLRLQAERLAVSESGDMVFDYAGKTDATKPNKVLLVGVLRQRLDQVEGLVDAAGLSAVAVTSAAMVLSRGARGGDQNAPMLVLGGHGAEMVWRHDGAPRMLRHVSGLTMNGHGPTNVGHLGSELGRTVTMTRANGRPARSEILMWDGVGLSPAQVAELSERSGLQLRPSDATAMLGLETLAASLTTAADRAGSAAADAETFAPALALALAGADRGLLPLDFTRSRLTPRKKQRVGRLGTWAIVAGALVVLATIGLYVMVEMRQSEANGLAAEILNTKTDVEKAETTVARVNYTKGYFGSRPPFLECFREVTLTVRDVRQNMRGNEQLYTTNFTLRDNRKGQIEGKALEKETAQKLLERLQKNPKFSGVQFQYIRDAGTARAREIAFAIGFNYVAPE
jgi:hypothetical protein